MYIPKRFENTDPVDIKKFIDENGFAIIVSHHQGQLAATHVPLQLNASATTLTGHLSRANTQWKSFNTEDEVLVIFNGPHAYISSSWYDHENVPTWNYLSAHVYGKVRIIEGDELLASVTELVDKYERFSEKPVSVEGMSAAYIQQQLKGVVGIEIRISSIQAARKLSQNRDSKNYHAIIAELEKRNENDDAKIAKAMKQQIQNIKP